MSDSEYDSEDDEDYVPGEVIFRANEGSIHHCFIIVYINRIDKSLFSHFQKIQSAKKI